MSFSSKIKNELISYENKNNHCKESEVLGYMLVSGIIVQKNTNNILKINIENEVLAKKYFTILQKTFNINTEFIVKTSTTRKKEVYVLKTSLVNFEGIQNNLANNYIPENNINMCCKRAYLRGAFLGGGSVSNPEKAYHLEFVVTTQELADSIQQTMISMDLDAKIVKRKNNHVVYLKEGAQIVDLLNIMGAHIALMELENIRIVKEVRNNVNRLVNCELANLTKTVSAAVRQVEDIKYLQETIGLSALPPNLEKVARYRLLHEEASLKEIGQKLDPPVGKSGINHRFKKISDIALEIREKRGGFNND